ncbi:malate synthase A [Georgfuchsia toluolica]|uniref:Malate synthase n=1 Tax=Georgfuchsia toluolica TaxID=424218 RepID=A0A916J3N9_9PROT|nr:malate synthase A [Georgfuchsia toluolica]CAG4882656.1 malate synthase A [Georgfuchsia toluolica]
MNYAKNTAALSRRAPMSFNLPKGVRIDAPLLPRFEEILTHDALEFVARLHRTFESRRRELIAARARRQMEFDAGMLPDFLPDTAHIRSGSWTVAPCPADLQDRRVEITGPTERKMVINAMNSGASVFMADFEDSNTPTWENLIQGQINLRDTIDGTISYTSTEGKSYRLAERTATLLVRPRGWHLLEKHVQIDGDAVAGSIFDFALYFFHNAKQRIANGSGVYFYLPKMESHLEARLWNDVFIAAQDMLGVPQGTIKATVLIETVLAAFEMDEILYELREHSAGLNIGRWDYIFSCIKKFRSRHEFCLADRARVTMTAPFLRAYALLLIKTCHRRNAFAMGGMAAQIPIKNDPAANEAALEKVRADKLREVTDGCDGTWVAHPGLVAIAKEIFDRHMPTPNQIQRQRNDVNVTARDLLQFEPETPITEEGLRNNISVGVQYLGSWLAGNGCVPVFNLMEDAATAEISRSQIWQWIRNPKGVLDDGRKVTELLFRQLLAEELPRIRTLLGEKGWNAGQYENAARLFEQITTSDKYTEFLTLPAYEMIM